MLIKVGSRLVLAPPDGVPGRRKRNRAAGGNGILRDDVADFERVRARQRNHQRNRRVGLDGVQQIRATSAPAGRRRLVGNGSLPLGLLVGVGKKLRRLGVSAGEILRAGDRINQRAGVEQERQLALAEKRLQFGAARMQAVGVAVAVQRSDRQNGALRNGQHRRADGGVIVVFATGWSG